MQTNFVQRKSNLAFCGCNVLQNDSRIQKSSELQFLLNAEVTALG